MQQSLWTKIKWEMDKKLHPFLPEKSDFEFTKNYRNKSFIAAKIYYNQLLKGSYPKPRKIFLENLERLFMESLQNLTDYDYQSYHQRVRMKNLEATLPFVDFFQGVTASTISMHCIAANKTIEKEYMGTIQEYSVEFLTNHGSSTPQKSICTATCLPSHRSF